MRRKIIPYSPHLKALAAKLRKNMTKPEVLLWNQLKQKQMEGQDFDRQRPIDQYIVDFYCKDLQLAIEIDGAYHNDLSQQIKDAARQSRLEFLGVHFLRFDNDMIEKDMFQVLHIIRSWILENKPNIEEDKKERDI